MGQVPQVKIALKAAEDKPPPSEPPPTPKKDDKPRPAAVDDDLESMSYQQLMKLAYAQHDTKLVEAALMSQVPPSGQATRGVWRGLFLSPEPTLVHITH